MTSTTSLPISLQLLFITLCVTFFLYQAYLKYRSRAKLSLPPGPPGKLLIGNALDVPLINAWETFRGWEDEYGDVIHLSAFGQHSIILNSVEAAWDLLEKRSSIYSDRIDIPMLTDLMGHDWNLGFMRYGDKWRNHRKMFRQELNPNSVSKYHDNQMRHTHDLLKNLQETPKSFVPHILHMTAGIVVEAFYGFEIRPENDPLVNTANETLEAVVKAAIPGTFLVNMIPLLKYVPEWFPGATFQKKAREWKVLNRKMLNDPYEVAKETYLVGKSKPSLIASLLDSLSSQPTNEAQEDTAKGVGATAFTAGVETTGSSLQSFVLAMLLNPEAQTKAQDELDRVVGPNRLPDFSDQQDLPYIRAVCKEVLRWQPATPLGVPHRNTQDDEYRGMRIPKGTTVIANQWHILRSEKHFGAKPNEFRPERFLEGGEKDITPAFGFGRRICLGRYLADDTMFIAISSILHLFRISRAKDEMGNEIEVSGKYTCDLTSHPEPFDCDVLPRSDAARRLLGTISE